MRESIQKLFTSHKIPVLISTCAWIVIIAGLYFAFANGNDEDPLPRTPTTELNDAKRA